MKRSLIADMQQSSATVHIVNAKDGQALLEAGLVRESRIDPPPPRGKMAVNLTARGRGHDADDPIGPDTSDDLTGVEDQTD